MNIRRIYILSDFKLSPKDCVNHNIFPKLVGFYKGKPVLEIDFIDTKENRNLIQYASSHEKVNKEKIFGATKLAKFFGFGREPRCLRFMAPAVPHGEVSPAVDVDFLKSFISAGVEKMKEYIQNEDYYSAFISAESIKKAINLISNFKETEQAKIVPTEGIGIHEFNIQEFEEDLEKAIPEDEFYILEKSVEGTDIKYSTIKPLSINTVKNSFNKLASKYPYLKDVLEAFLNEHSSLFTEKSASTAYFTKEGSVLKEVEVKEGSKKNSVQVKLALSKDAVKAEIFKKLMATILKEAYIRKTPGAKNSKGESAPWCIYSHKTGKKISCHKTKSEAEKHLRRMEYYKHKKKGSFYFVTIGNNPVFITRDFEEAVNKKEKLANFANILAYTNTYLLKDSSYDTLRNVYTLLKRAEQFYKATDILPLTVKDDQVRKFTEFVDEAIDTLEEIGAPYRAAFTVVNSNKDVSLSPKETSAVNEIIDKTLQEKGFVLAGGDGESVYSRSISSTGRNKNANPDEIKRKLVEIFNKYNITDPKEFPPTSFSIAIVVDTEPKIAASNSGVFAEKKEEK